MTASPPPSAPPPAEQQPSEPPFPAELQPLVLVRRLAPAAAEPTELVLALSADQRTRLRGRRLSRCGQPLLLQLPRGEALQPGERLAPAEAGPLVRVEAAAEALVLVRSEDPLALLQAAYHLGNRHVAMEIRPGELRLLDDPVLVQLLSHRGLQLEHAEAPFQPETGAYGHSHSHSQDQSQDHSQDHSHHSHG